MRQRVERRAAARPTFETCVVSVATCGQRAERQDAARPARIQWATQQPARGACRASGRARARLRPTCRFDPRPR